jgi:hypothetical protein
MIDDNAQSPQDQAKYNVRYTELVRRYERYKCELDGIEAELIRRIAKREGIVRFLAELEQCGPLKEFAEVVWYAAVERVTIGLGGEMGFMFKDGTSNTEYT